MMSIDQSKQVLILDGGMSRELIRLNAPFRQPEWSAFALMEAPEFVKQVHKDFIDAGADVITTDSYALVPFHIGEEAFQRRGAELAALSGRLAREAADEEQAKSGRTVLVAGSLPPIFGSYEPDRFDASRVQDYLGVLVQALSPYVDVWLGETLSLIAEGEAVQTAVKSTRKPFWISFTIDDREQKSSASLRSGESVESATKWAVHSGADALLFNCSEPEYMSQAVREAKATMTSASQTIRLGVYANAFEPTPKTYAANDRIVSVRSDLDGEVYASLARQWGTDGAMIIGGCCGIGRDHIRKLVQAVKRAGEA